MGKDAYYFKHDSNAKDDPKCVLLIEQLGLEGYGIYWILIETLRDQPGYRYPLALVPALARRYNTSSQKVEAVIRGYGLFSVDDDSFFFSYSLIERMRPMEEQRETARLAGMASAEKRRKQALLNRGSTGVERALNDRSTIREDKRREEKSKKDKSKGDIPPPIDLAFIKNDSVVRAFGEFAVHRMQIKKPWTQLAAEKAYKQIVKLYPDIQDQVLAVENAIAKGWQGIYPMDKKANSEKEPQADYDYSGMADRFAKLDLD